MYGPKWPFLLRYGSRDTRCIDILRVDGLSTRPPGMGRHMHCATTLMFRVAGTFVQCFDTSVQYCTIPSSTYCATSLSFIVTGLCRKYLYDVHLNNE